MSDEELKTLLPGDDDFERALDQSDHERAKRAIMTDPHVRGTLAELREELRAGEMPFRYRPDAPRSDPPEPMGPDSKRERDTVRGLGNPASQSTPPPPMVAEAAPEAPADEGAPTSPRWSPNDATTRADTTVGGRTARLKVAEAPPSSRPHPGTPAPATARGDTDARSYQLPTLDGSEGPSRVRDAQDRTRADVRGPASAATHAAHATHASVDDGEREITGAGANSTSPWVAPVPHDGSDHTPAPRNPLDDKDTIRNLPAPRNRGLGALVAGACLACAFVAIIALVTARNTPVQTARAWITMPRAPAWQPPPETTESQPATPPAPALPGEARPAGESATPALLPSSSPEPEHVAPAPRPEAPPASSSDRWF